MNPLIESLNLWGERLVQFAGPMLWQSSLLIVVLFALDFALRRQVRAGVRYALWLVVLVKLLLPPTLALPTGVAWWLRPAPHPAKPESRRVIVTYGGTSAHVAPPITLPSLPTPPPKLSLAGGAAAASALVSLGLLAWLMFRWRQVARVVWTAAPATEALNEYLDAGKRCLSLRRTVRLRLTDRPMSPAVCGLFHPVILLPRPLAEQLPPGQLRAVLLHELVHLKRGDVWVNCAQAVLQIAYWWNPLLWLANARIRRVREEAVDDAVMLALRDDADTYAPTLLAVAKLAFRRPLASLGFMGIMESRSAMRHRIERLVSFQMPGKAGFSVLSLLGIAAFTALAVPMGEAPAHSNQPSPSAQIKNSSPLILADAGSPAVADQKPHFVVAPIAAGDGNAKPTGELSPDAQPGAATKVSMVCILEVREDGSYWAANKRFDLAGLKTWLTDPKWRNAPIGYSLNIHSNAPPESVRALRELCQEVGISTATASAAPPLASPDSDARTNSGRQVIFQKLNSIRLENVGYEAMPLGELLLALSKESKKCDPEKRGVNFIVNPNTAATGTNNGSSAGTGSVGLLAMPISLQPPLTNVRLMDVLAAIVKVAPEPILFSVEDYAVVFRVASWKQVQPLFVRTFKIQPDDLLANLRKKTGFTSTNTEAISEALRTVFAERGVELQPPKNLYFNPGQGRLLVRASMAELDQVERAIQELNYTLPQVNIKVRFVEIEQWDANTAYLRNILTNNDGFVNVSSNFPAVAQANTRLIAPVASDSGQNAQLVGLLTDPQFRVVWRALEEWKQADTLSQGEITTLPGREAEIQIAEQHTIATGIKPQALRPPGVTSSKKFEVPVFQTQAMLFGYIFNVIPTISPDGRSVTLRMIPTVAEFLGYDKEVVTTVYINGLPENVGLPLPRFRTQQMTNNLTVWDGQTIVLGGLTLEKVIKTKDKIPGLGDLPLAGRWFRSEISKTEKHILLIFITPTIIDPAGNRVHKDDEMPFARGGIPPQKSR